MSQFQNARDQLGHICRLTLLYNVLTTFAGISENPWLREKSWLDMLLLDDADRDFRWKSYRMLQAIKASCIRTIFDLKYIYILGRMAVRFDELLVGFSFLEAFCCKVTR